MYKALYRKYRPVAFSEVAGQPHITETLKNQLAAGRLGHAYLFTGSRGTGKTSCAKILAKAVNCLEPQNGDPCGVCENCKMAESGAMLDILEIDAASNSGVDNIRDLREKANYTPAAGKYRVYIIDEVHMLSTGAFNALLKTLEEPPAHTLFILATTEVHKLPATILSRCQRFDFKRIAPEEIAKRLAFVAEREGLSLDTAAALLIARLSDGALRDALSLLDVCAASGEAVTEEAVLAAAGLAGRDYLHRLSDAVLGGSAPDALRVLDELHAASLDMQRLCEEMIGHFRDLLICKSVPDPSALVPAASAELAALRQKAGDAPLSVILHALGVLEDALQKIARGAHRRTEMELAFIKLCTPALDASPEALSRRIDALERGAGGRRGGKARQKPDEPSPAEPEPLPPPDTSRGAEESIPPEPSFPGPDEPIPSDAPPPPEETLSPGASALPPERCPFWPELLEQLKASNPLIAAVLQNADAYIRGDFLLIDPHSEQFREMMNSSATHRNSIRAAAFAASGIQYRLGPYTACEPAPPEEEPDPLDTLQQKLSDAGVLK